MFAICHSRVVPAVAVALACTLCPPAPAQDVDAPLPAFRTGLDTRDQPPPPPPPRAATTLARSGGEVLAVSWDLLWFPGGVESATADQARRDMDTAKAALAVIAPDVALIQRLRSRAAAEDLASAVPGMRVANCSESSLGPPDNAILTRLPVLGASHENWEPGLTEINRGFSWATLLLPDGRKALFYTTRFAPNLNGIDRAINRREDMADQLLRHIAATRKTYQTDYVVFGGSMNTNFAEKRFEQENSIRRFLKMGFDWGFEGIPYVDATTAARDYEFGESSIDHFLTLGLGKCPAKPLPQFNHSDHFPVELRIPPKR